MLSMYAVITTSPNHVYARMFMYPIEYHHIPIKIFGFIWVNPPWSSNKFPIVSPCITIISLILQVIMMLDMSKTYPMNSHDMYMIQYSVALILWSPHTIAISHHRDTHAPSNEALCMAGEVLQVQLPTWLQETWGFSWGKKCSESNMFIGKGWKNHWFSMALFESIISQWKNAFGFS